MKKLIKKIFSPRNFGAVIAILIVTGATALAQIPAYKSWLLQGTNLFTTGTNVGIDTQTPAEKLDVAGTVQTTGFKMPTGAGSGLVLTSDTSGVGTWQAPVPGGGIGGSGLTNFIPKFTSNVTIGNSTIFQSPPLPIIGSNIGIGTIAPANKLSVAGNADVNRLGIGIAAPLVNQLEVNGRAAIGTTYAGTAAPADGLIVEGDVGIGEMNPSAKLHIEQSGVNDALRVDGPAGPFGAPSVVVIKSAGKVGIGTLSPVNKLDIDGEAVIGASYAGINAAPGSGLLVEGDVGIGTPTPTERLDLGGGNIKMGYEIVSALGSGVSATASVSCPAGPNPPQTQKQLVGGGCYALPGGLFNLAMLRASYPSSPTTWSCIWEPQVNSPTAYAICANIR